MSVFDACERLARKHAFEDAAEQATRWADLNTARQRTASARAGSAPVELREKYLRQAQKWSARQRALHEFAAWLRREAEKL